MKGLIRNKYTCENRGIDNKREKILDFIFSTDYYGDGTIFEVEEKLKAKSERLDVGYGRALKEIVPYIEHAASTLDFKRGEKPITARCLKKVGVYIEDKGSTFDFKKGKRSIFVRCLLDKEFDFIFLKRINKI